MSSLPLPIAAFVAGLMSFLSPCVLPLVPGYVSLISGNTVDELKDPEKRVSKSVLGHSIMFILGFSIVFIALGAAATEVGQLIHENLIVLSRIAGVVIVIFGLHLIGVFKITALYSDKRLHSIQGGKSPVGAFVVGFAFAFGWTPCIGPILAGILALAANSGTLGKGILLLAVYSLGLAVPFLLTSLGINQFLSFYGRFRRHLHKVEVLSGILLIVIGVLIFFRHFTVLSGYLSFLNRFTTL